MTGFVNQNLSDVPPVIEMSNDPNGLNGPNALDLPDDVLGFSRFCYFLGGLVLERAKNGGYVFEDSSVFRLFVGFWLVYGYFGDDGTKSTQKDSVEVTPLIEEVD
jgi:hypothetical protein